MSNSNAPPSKLESRQAPRVLVIDDEPDLRTLYEMSLSRAGYQVDCAEDLSQAFEKLALRKYQVVVSDMQLPDGLGLEVLRYLSHNQRNERCVVITAHGSAQNAVDALKAGAFDYLTKPVDLKQFRAVLTQAIESGSRVSTAQESDMQQALKPTPLSGAAALADENLSPVARTALGRIVGNSLVMQQVRERIVKVARSMAPVLVQGESGTGKELVARALHACSHRASGPFIAVNCSAIPEALLEAEFFGARKGSYTGASHDREGFFQAAQGGTLFLDEIGDLPLAMQAKLLRAIQERSIRALGDTQETATNVRLLSATHKDLASHVAAGQFRQDLYYRINVIDLQLPALRERQSDLPELVHALLARIAQDNEMTVPVASERMLFELSQMPLHGNVRELENILHRALALFDGQQLQLEAQYLTDQYSSNHSPLPCTNRHALNIEPIDNTGAQSKADLPKDLQAHLDAQEKQILLQALKDNRFNRTAAASKLGISLRQIRYRMERLGIGAHDAEQ